MSDQASSKVIVSVGNCSVTIEAPEPLDTTTAQALALFREVFPAGADRPGPAAGFTSQLGLPTPGGNAAKQRGGDFRPIRATTEGDL